MTGAGDARRARARAADEETRYRAVGELCASDADDRAALLEALADASWRVRSGAADRLAVAPGAALPALVEVLSVGPNVGARVAAASALARIGAPALPALVARLAEGEPETRQAAAAVLGAIADRRAVPPLASRLADPDPNVRAAAAEALGKVGGPEAVSALRAAVDSMDTAVRLTAIEALAALRACLPPERVSALLAERGLRRAVYRLLGACDDPAGLRLVGRGLCEPSRSAREAALGALGSQRARRPVEALAPVLGEVRQAAGRDPSLADAWADALASEEPSVIAGALCALSVAGRPSHVAAMLRVAENERYRTLVEEVLEALPPGAELRAAVAEALPGLGQLARIAGLAVLARLGSPAALESVVRVASDGEAYAQGEAIAALGRLRDARAVAPLAGLLGDDAPSVAGTAASALVRIGQAAPEARRAVLDELRGRARASPSAALYRALGALGDAADLALLRDGSRSESVAQRSAAAAAVGALAQRRLLRGAPPLELLGALGDGAWSVRAAAARAFAELARAGAAVPEGVVAALGAGLGDPAAADRAAAAEALGAFDRRECAPALASLAADPAAPAPVVVAALHALAEMGAPPSDVVARAAAHPDPEVVKVAVLAAALLPGPEGERLVREAATSPRWDVRRAAACAMAERGDAALGAEAARLAAVEPDPLVARAFADAARALGGR